MIFVRWWTPRGVEEFPTEEEQENERLRLFALISELVTWKNTTNEEVLGRMNRFAGVGVAVAPTTSIIRKHRSCSTLKRCRVSTIPSPGAAPCH